MERGSFPSPGCAPCDIVRRDKHFDVLNPDGVGEVEEVFNCIIAQSHASERLVLSVNHNATPEVRAPIVCCPALVFDGWVVEPEGEIAQRVRVEEGNGINALGDLPFALL